MEGLPNQERKIEKSEVIELLKTRGFEDPEVKEFVTQWTLQREALVNQESTATASITLNMDRADLYVAIGDIEGALEALEDARLQAHQENETELYNQIMAKMDEIEG